jgi:hypothetical protein
MLRTVITPKKSTYSLSIPTHYIGKTVEVLLYSPDEIVETKKPGKKKPSDFFGTLNASEGEKIREYVTNSRLEWDRNI